MSLSAAPLALYVHDICAVAPGLHHLDEWKNWAKHPVIPTEGKLNLACVPAIFKRRASLATKLALETALGITLQQQPEYTIFASQHGEVERLIALLAQIANKETLSPMHFSQAVHNTASGLFSIIKKLDSNISSIAAGEQTFQMAILDALAYLQLNPQKQVLLTMFDEVLPAFYQTYMTYPHACPFALTLLLGKEPSTYAKPIKVQSVAQKTNKQVLPGALSFLAWALGDTTGDCLLLPMNDQSLQLVKID
ncbi:beta-ketoacyl synthase chain length factor [Facilibium subflavum]|uniref:beta-ketoacyl synthase chain length factor n=1 Tax=Facilibium subflavum TaxID=2219058 RepID=UPI000E652FD6|nr:beta-ketoacyl synthase chain length factor [Facilibium subflavum]